MTLQQLVCSTTEEEFDAGEVLKDEEFGLFVGSLAAANASKQVLERYGIKAVLTAARGLHVNKLPEGVAHLSVSLADHPAEQLLPKLQECFDFIDRYREQGSVLVHCASGVSRSVAVCVAYIMRCKSYPFEVSLEIVRQGRVYANPNSGFRIQLQLLEDAGGNTDRALELFRSKLKPGETFMTAITVARNDANALHARMDEIEVCIQSHPQQVVSEEQRTEIESLQKEALYTIDHAQLKDRVTLMILRWVIAKGKRLLELS